MENKENFSLNYSFSFEEVTLLAKFFRKTQDFLPEGLELFTRTLEDAVYNNLSLDQIRDFYEK